MRASDPPTVRVHWNRHKRRWSVKRGNARIEHVEALALRSAEFRVSAAGRARCLREGVRNVHAHVIGQRIDGWALVQGCARRVTYRPFERPVFVAVDSGEAVLRAAFVAFRPDVTAWASG